jgi:hypothetical protein
MAKKELTISEFREIIKEEALKLKKRIVLENEKKALEKELKTLNESYMEETMDEMNYEEGLEELFGFGKNKMTPEEAIEAGTEIVKSNPAKRGVYSMLAKAGDKNKTRKFLMYVGYTPDEKYPKWSETAMAPDKTEGYFVSGGKFGGQGSGGNVTMASEGYDELEEGLGSRIIGAFKGALYPTREKMTQAFLHFNNAWTKNGTLKVGLSKQSINELLDEAEADNFAGKPTVKNGKMAYLKGMDMTAKSGTSQGSVGGTAG